MSIFTFIALTTNEAITQEDYAKFVEAVRSAKNARSHIAGVFYYWEQSQEVAARFDYADYKYDFLREAGTYPAPAMVGAAIHDPGIETEPEASFFRYDIVQCGTRVCGE